MIRAGAIEKGTVLLMKGEPFVVVEREFVNPGKGSAFVRLKMKSISSGQTLRETMKTQDNVEDASVDERTCQYLYSDGEFMHFMNTESYEQFDVPVADFEEKKLFMKDGETYKVIVWEDRPIDIIIPYKVVYTVTEASDALKGDTVTNATKTVTLETGLTLRVPIFIKQGEKVLINTETREYVERVNS